jgi:hypothetical protein
MSELRPLHRLFGLSWIDFFRGTPVAVETEMDLSLKQEFIDVAGARPTAQGQWQIRQTRRRDRQPARITSACQKPLSP